MKNVHSPKESFEILILNNVVDKNTDAIEEKI